MMETISKKKIKIGISIFFCSVSLLFGKLFIYQEEYCRISKFNRIISFSSSVNLNIDKLTYYYYIFLISSCLGLYFATSLFSQKNYNKKRICDLIVLVIDKIESFKYRKLFYIPCLIVLLFVDLNKFAMGNMLQKDLSLALTASIGLFFCNYKLNNYVKRIIQIFSVVYSSNVLLFSVFFFLIHYSLNDYLFFAISVILIVFINKIYDYNDRIVYCLGIFNFISIINICLTLEVCFTLKCYGIFENKISQIILIFFLLEIVILFTSYKLVYIKYICINHRIKELYYWLAIFSISWISSIRQYKIVNFFESANHGISISEYINFNKIPMIDNFDAHIFSSSVLGILYYFINKDYKGALNSPYSYIYTVVLYVSIFAILKYIVRIERAYIFAVFFPVNDIVAGSSALTNDCLFMSGLFMLWVYMHWSKKNSFRNSIILWLSAEISLLISLDIGVAFGLPAIIMAFVDLIIKQNKKDFFKFISPGIILSVYSAGLLYLLTYDKVGFIYWIKRFQNTVFSSQHWAYSIISVHDKIIHYISIPLLFFLAAFTIIRVIRPNKNGILSLYFVILSFILNSSRTVVRHNINENSKCVSCYIVLGFSIIGIIIADIVLEELKDMYIPNIKVIEVSIHEENNRVIDRETKDYRINSKDILKFFIVVFIVLLWGENSKNNFMLLQNQIQNVDFCLHNYVENDEINHMSNKLNFIFNKTISEDETFFDFANFTNIHSYVFKPNPVYVNQSPSLINGIDGQRDAIKSLQENRKNIPLVLMYARGNDSLSRSIDDILNTDRFYLITEYLYNNYCPLYNDGDYTIWCDKERYSLLKNEIENHNSFNDNSIFDNIHKLGYIPYLWANNDEKTINSYNLLDYSINKLKCIDKSNGNYLIIRAYAERDVKDFEIKLNYNNETNEVYILNLLKGTNYYKIRISTDYDWYISNINNIETMQNDKVFAIDYFFTEGD